jgi:hypothetical protein
MGSPAGCWRPRKHTCSCNSSYTSIAVCIELSNSEKCRVEAFNKTLGTPIVTRAHKWRAQTANSDLTPNSAQEAARQVAKNDAVHHARMKAQQSEILKNQLKKEKDLAIKAKENRRRSAEQRVKQSAPLQGPTQSPCLSLAAYTQKQNFDPVPCDKSDKLEDFGMCLRETEASLEACVGLVLQRWSSYSLDTAQKHAKAIH